MTWTIIAIIAFVGLWMFERNRNQRLRYQNRQLSDRVSHLEGLVYPKGSESDEDQDAIDSAELNDLKQRVQVLERIATDENSSEARKAQRIAREIESLRGDIARRSSKKVEELSE